jgi:YggT family protein
MSAVGALLGTVLLLFELVLVARMVVDWVGVLAPGGSTSLVRVRRVLHRLTEPVLGPARRVLPPLRIGSFSLDLAFTAVFIAVLVLRGLVAAL